MLSHAFGNIGQCREHCIPARIFLQRGLRSVGLRRGTSLPRLYRRRNRRRLQRQLRPVMFPLPTGHTVVTAMATSWMSVAISALKLRSSAMAVTKVSRPTRLDFHLARGNQRQPQRIYFRQSAGTRRCSGRNCARRSAICNLTIVHVSIGHFIHSDVCRGLAQRSRGTDH